MLTGRALITGITGQNDSYLAEHMLAEGYQVWGLVRGQASPRVRRVRQLVTMMVNADLQLLSALAGTRMTPSARMPGSQREGGWDCAGHFDGFGHNSWLSAWFRRHDRALLTVRNPAQ